MKKIEGLDYILLVDDDEATNFVHRLVIESAKIDVELGVCYNGKECIELLTENNSKGEMQPDIIFLDINMPEMNGWEFLEEFENLPFDTTGIKVVAMLTTSLNPDDEERARSIPALSDFIQKPLSQERLMHIINGHFHPVS